jgi:hypothetical protein
MLSRLEIVKRREDDPLLSVMDKYIMDDRKGDRRYCDRLAHHIWEWPKVTNYRESQPWYKIGSVDEDILHRNNRRGVDYTRRHIDKGERNVLITIKNYIYLERLKRYG